MARSAKGGVMANEMMQQVLKILENDARTTPEQIATMVARPVEEVKKVIKQAENERIILKYKTLVNWDKAGEESVLAMIGVKLMPQKDVGFDSIAERIYRFPQVRTVYLVSGVVDLMILIVAKRSQEIAEFVSQHLATIEGVQETITQFLLKRYKEEGEIIEGKEEAKRQQVVL
jgi:DNA-binding Lrp family transcriptional regulator